MPNEIWADVIKIYNEVEESKLGQTKETFHIRRSFSILKVWNLKTKARKNNDPDLYKKLKKQNAQKIRRDKVAWLE